MTNVYIRHIVITWLILSIQQAWFIMGEIILL